MDRKNKRRRNRSSINRLDIDTLDMHNETPNIWGVTSAWDAPLGIDELHFIDEAVKEILSKTGMSDAPDEVKDIVIKNGGHVDGENRLLFPVCLISKFLREVKKDIKLCGRDVKFDLDCSGRKSYLGTGGASPNILDLKTQRYRESRLVDIYDAARIVEKMENIHFFSRPMVARDMESEHDLDINTAYACLKGTRKHIMTSISNPSDVTRVAQMCFLISGSKEAFIKRPFLSLNVNHSVSPLRYDGRSVKVIIEAAKIGIPVQVNTFAQVGASTAVSLASALAQTTAETFSGMILSWLVNPDSSIIFGGRPMITDLRTGALSGGGGEQARVMAASIQVAQHYNLCNSCIAGATDSKIPDAQSGYEKGIGVLTSAMAGSNLITQASGTHASLMGTALESYIIDNDMAGVVLRSIETPKVNAEEINVKNIDEVVRGAGHFLGDAETYNRMRSDYLYPKISNRDSIEEWELKGQKSVWDLARERVEEILKVKGHSCISDEADKEIKKQFKIYLG